jgi:hypothetical protein
MPVAERAQFGWVGQRPGPACQIPESARWRIECLTMKTRRLVKENRTLQDQVDDLADELSQRPPPAAAGAGTHTPRDMPQQDSPGSEGSLPKGAPEEESWSSGCLGSPSPSPSPSSSPSSSPSPPQSCTSSEVSSVPASPAPPSPPLPPSCCNPRCNCSCAVELKVEQVWGRHVVVCPLCTTNGACKSFWPLAEMIQGRHKKMEAHIRMHRRKGCMQATKALHQVIKSGNKK